MTLEFVFIDRLTEEQTRQFHELFEGEWWTKGRTLADVQRMLTHTDFVFAFCEKETHKLAAFARVLSDCAYKAFIFDVIVAPEHRARKLGAALMEAILNHPELKGVRHFELYCLSELVPFYEKWGFTAEVGEIRLMRKSKRA